MLVVGGTLLMLVYPLFDPHLYGATIRAHLRNHGAAKRHGRQDRQQYAVCREDIQRQHDTMNDILFQAKML